LVVAVVDRMDQVVVVRMVVLAVVEERMPQDTAPLPKEILVVELGMET
tara:strand:- start:347 stop:490 length:144 start_codon:yes stop_codon:yes gene_type:complete